MEENRFLIALLRIQSLLILWRHLLQQNGIDSLPPDIQALINTVSLGIQAGGARSWPFSLAFAARRS
jgi:hypothetical protein